MLYGYAKLGGWDFRYFRVMGPGLGNMLFPWARLVVAAQHGSIIPIAPAWPQLKIGSILRNDADKRFYFGLFRPLPCELSGWDKWKVLTRLPHIPERALNEALRQTGGKDSLLTFEGMNGFFQPILREHALVRRHLLGITNEKHKCGLAFDFRNSISVHVRLGDFVAKNRLPISWYVDAIEQVRFSVARCAPVYVFSDGADEELSELLDLPGVQRISFGSSIADLIALSRAQVLIASASTFSMWASYLGRMPVIWHREKHAQQLYYAEHELDTEVEIAEGEGLSAEFSGSLANRFQGWNQKSNN